MTATAAVETYVTCPACHGLMVVPKQFFPQQTEDCGGCDGIGEVAA